MAWGSLLWVIGIVCAVWVIYDVWTQNRKLDQGWKIIWTVLAIVLSIVTAIVYYVMYKK